MIASRPKGLRAKRTLANSRYRSTHGFYTAPSACRPKIAHCANRSPSSEPLEQAVVKAGSPFLEAPEHGVDEHRRRLRAADNTIAEPDEVPTLPQPCFGRTKWPE
jgi:hypothetical protein